MVNGAIYFITRHHLYQPLPPSSIFMKDTKVFKGELRRIYLCGMDYIF